jgi:hypothetical protein
MGAIKPLRSPSTRGIERNLRTARLLAARSFRPGTVPRVAILMGHWDGGLVGRIASVLTTKGTTDGNQS